MRTRNLDHEILPEECIGLREVVGTHRLAARPAPPLGEKWRARGEEKRREEKRREERRLCCCACKCSGSSNWTLGAGMPRHQEYSTVRAKAVAFDVQKTVLPLQSSTLSILPLLQRKGQFRETAAG